MSDKRDQIRDLPDFLNDDDQESVLDAEDEPPSLFDDEDEDEDAPEIGGADDRQRTPIGATPIVLNPKVEGDATALCCPDCGDEIAAESFKDGAVVEYRCGCDDLQKFRIRGAE